MGILSNLDGTSVLILFACLAGFGPVRLYLRGCVLRLHGASKHEVKSELLKAAQDDHVVVQIARALRGAPEPTVEPESKPEIAESPPPIAADDAEDRSNSP